VISPRGSARPSARAELTTMLLAGKTTRMRSQPLDVVCRTGASVLSAKFSPPSYVPVRLPHHRGVGGRLLEENSSPSASPRRPERGAPEVTDSTSACVFPRSVDPRTSSFDCRYVHSRRLSLRSRSLQKIHIRRYGSRRSGAGRSAAPRALLRLVSDRPQPAHRLDRWRASGPRRLLRRPLTDRGPAGTLRASVLPYLFHLHAPRCPPRGRQRRAPSFSDPAPPPNPGRHSPRSATSASAGPRCQFPAPNRRRGARRHAQSATRCGHRFRKIRGGNGWACAFGFWMDGRLPRFHAVVPTAFGALAGRCIIPYAAVHCRGICPPYPLPPLAARRPLALRRRDACLLEADRASAAAMPCA